MAEAENNYNAENIQVLEGMEAVRKRPAMYIGDTGERGYHHLVYEVVDNSIDEAVAGFCSTIRITIDKGNYVTVEDNGPGFDPEVDRNLRRNMDEILQTGILPSLKIEGMGILNIFIRLYLLDGIPFVFDFGNKEEGGAFVTVGGHVKTD